MILKLLDERTVDINKIIQIFQADYSPRAKRRDGGQQTRPISADVGRLFAVEEHSNERTGTSAVSGASSSGSHAQGGFKKGT